MRRIEAGVHVRAKLVDVDRVGPLGGMALLTLQEMEPVAIQKLVVELRRDKSQMTRIIQMLEAKGHVERQPCPKDGRVSILKLTQKGTAFVGELNLIMSEVIEEVLVPLEPAEREMFTSMLKKL